jgi:hypothetical protein
MLWKVPLVIHDSKQFSFLQRRFDDLVGHEIILHLQHVKIIFEKDEKVGRT